MSVHKTSLSVCQTSWEYGSIREFLSTAKLLFGLHFRSQVSEYQDSSADKFISFFSKLHFRLSQLLVATPCSKSTVFVGAFWTRFSFRYHVKGISMGWDLTLMTKYLYCYHSDNKVKVLSN